MYIHRTNPNSPATTRDDMFRAMQRHAAATAVPPMRRDGDAIPGSAPPLGPPPSGPLPAAGSSGNGGDILYGARAIAIWLFTDGSQRARRRVFHLWAHYRDRNEKAGLFKLKGALCLSKSKWLAFHGLG